MTDDFGSGEREALQARILADRADLARTVEALAAKTRLRARTRRTAHDAADEVKAAVEAMPRRLGRWVGRSVGSARRRLAVVAVLAGVITVLLTAVRPRIGGSTR